MSSMAHKHDLEVSMNEKVFKTVANTGIANLVMGIVIIVTGVTSGVLLIISGAKLMKSKEDLII
jgi:hypothetical protein